MRKNLIKLFISVVILSVSCSKEYELNKSVFIPDRDFPDLPAYTERGYNTFGAYYDRELFLYDDNTVPVKVINTGGKTSFTLKGHKGNTGYYSGTSSQMSLSFGLHGFLPDSYSDLIALNDTIINLQDSLCQVSLLIDNAEPNVRILNGSLNFKRAQNLIVDKEQVEVILSGTFEFQALIDNEPISITSGRFDVGVGTGNFFRY